MTAGPIRALALAALGATLPAMLATPLAAQGRPLDSFAPDQTGTGSGPASTITAPNTNSLGVTKPPGDSLGPGEVPPRRVQRRERALTDRIENSICDGCN